MDDVQTIYDDLWSTTFPLFQQGQYEIDPLINDPEDTRRGLTLRARLNPGIILKIEEFTQKLRSVVPDQYFIPASDLHLTVLAVINCQSGVQYDNDRAQSYIKAVSDCIEDLPAPRIEFTGITASPSCLLLQGYPENDSLERLRNRLRESFKTSDLPHSVDARYRIKTAHVTIMRFQKRQASLRGFAQFISAHKNHRIGIEEIQEVELVANDWYHKSDITKAIQVFPF